MIYIDNASTTFPKPESVYSVMDTFYRQQGMNAGRGQYKAAATADRLIKDTRNQVKNLFNCNANYETVFTSTATEAVNTILQGLDYSRIKTVYVTPFEHNAVRRTLSCLQNKRNFDIIELKVNRKSIKYDLKLIQKQFTEVSPDLVVLTHASNVCGLLAPVEDITALAKKHNSFVVIDMAQTAGLIDTDLTAANIDAAIFAGHKTLYGPFGASGFVLNKDMPLLPLIYGGTGLDSVKVEMPTEVPDRFEAGSRNIQAIAGLHESIRWITDTGVKAIFKKETELTDTLVELLSEYKNIRIIGGGDSVGIVSCVFEGYAPDNIGDILNRYDIAVRTGLHCAPSAHKWLGTMPAGTVRFSLGYFNDKNDIDALDEALRYIQENG